MNTLLLAGVAAEPASNVDLFARGLALLSLLVSAYAVIAGRRDLRWKRRTTGLDVARASLLELRQLVSSDQTADQIAMGLWSGRSERSLQTLLDEKDGISDRQLRKLLGAVVNCCQAARGPRPAAYDTYNPAPSRTLDAGELLALGRAPSRINEAVARIDKLRRMSTG